MKKLLVIFLSFAMLQGNAQGAAAEKVQCKQVVIDFLKWYKINSLKLYKLSPLKSLEPKNENDQHYKIDWKKADKYFAFIRANVPWLGEQFIKNEILFFKHCDQQFKENPSEEMPMGFDADRFIGGQEDASYMVPPLLKEMKNWKVSINVNHAKVYKEYREAGDSSGVLLEDKWELVKEKGKWKISKCLGLGDFAEG